MIPMPTEQTPFLILDSPDWRDYELLDSGDGLKLERFGAYIFARPESQAMWTRALSARDWSAAHANFQPTAEESGGHWIAQKKIPERWQMTYGDLKFWAMTTPGRHLGVFPEVAAHWDWMAGLVKKADRPVSVLNLFGYTGLASLAVAAAGAKVTHVDASKKSVAWARENQELSRLGGKPIRWIVDDALKFVERDVRRGTKYDGIVLDPPKFGRGPKGEIWEVYKSLPDLFSACRAVLSDRPLFVVTTVYAVRASALHVGQAMDEMMRGFKGEMERGELVTREKSAGRYLSQAVFARWSSK
jgi:23S rRNA (cytosine1962-C5)-methyltransferase